MGKPSARGLKMLFNFFQYALVTHNTTLAWLLFKAIKKTGKDVRKYDYSRHNARRRLKGVKVYFTESNGANIFRNVHVR